MSPLIATDGEMRFIFERNPDAMRLAGLAGFVLAPRNGEPSRQASTRGEPP